MLVLEIEMWGGSLGSRYRKPEFRNSDVPNSSKAKMFQKNYGTTQSWRLVALKWWGHKENQEEIKTKRTQIQK